MYTINVVFYLENSDNFSLFEQMVCTMYAVVKRQGFRGGRGGRGGKTTSQVSIPKFVSNLLMLPVVCVFLLPV